jgi:hypothetical protein
MWISRDSGRRPANFHMIVRNDACRRWQNGECLTHNYPLTSGLRAVQQQDPHGKVPPPCTTFASEPGDAIIIHTGWGKLWDKEPARYARATPALQSLSL